MNKNLQDWNDTIIALATPPGIGAIGVIRLSGANAIRLAGQLFTGKDLMIQDSHTAHVGMLRDEKILDEVVLTIFKAPRSYTGEDVVEISGHGSPFILEQIIQASIRQYTKGSPAGKSRRIYATGVPEWKDGSYPGRSRC